MSHEDVLPALAKSLSPEFVTAGELEGVSRACNLVVDTCGVKATVNGMPATVTEFAHQMEVNGNQYNVRLARFATGKDEKDSKNNIYAIFDASAQKPKDVTTLNPYALRLINQAGYFSLITDNELQPIVNDAASVHLLQDIATDIAHQAKGLIEKRKSDSDKQKSERRSRIGRRLGKVATGVLVIGALYGHLPFGHVDAKIGPVPMPQPIEALVDWNNHSDHMATGFSRPDGALPIDINTERQVRAPYLANYDTSDVPSALAKSGNGEAAHHLSKPGLYSIDVTYSPLFDAPVGAPDKASTCTNVTGDFLPGKTRIFTNNPKVSEITQVSVLDQKTMQICPSNGVAFPEGSRVYIWHEK